MRRVETLSVAGGARKGAADARRERRLAGDSRGTAVRDRAVHCRLVRSEDAAAVRVDLGRDTASNLGSADLFPKKKQRDLFE